MTTQIDFTQTTKTTKPLTNKVGSRDAAIRYLKCVIFNQPLDISETKKHGTLSGKKQLIAAEWVQMLNLADFKAELPNISKDLKEKYGLEPI